MKEIFQQAPGVTILFLIALIVIIILSIIISELFFSVRDLASQNRNLTKIIQMGNDKISDYGTDIN